MKSEPTGKSDTCDDEEGGQRRREEKTRGCWGQNLHLNLTFICAGRNGRDRKGKESRRESGREIEQLGVKTETHSGRKRGVETKRREQYKHALRQQ